MQKDIGISTLALPMLLASLVVFTNAACKPDPEPVIRAYAEGRLTISAQEDSTQDYSGFELLVATQTEGDVDTLGIAVTARDGSFTMPISASHEGIFPLIISRANTRLLVVEYVVADGDSAMITATFPIEGRRLRIVSPENSAWAAYRNAKYQHNQSLIGLVENQTASLDNMERVVRQTSSVLWSLRTSFPRAFASDLAAVESVAMLEGFSDSLVVARSAEIELDNPTIVNAVRAARRSVARLDGLDSSLALIRSYRERLTQPGQQAELQAEMVLALSDSARNDEALAAALELRRDYPNTEWSDWASQAIYEFENLLPGMEAPAFSVVDSNGKTVTSQSLRGKYVILEFFEPTNEIFLKEYDRRKSVLENLDPRYFTSLSLSVEPDSVVNMALFEEGSPPGRFVFLPGGHQSEVARLYNVQSVPTRFLVDPSGKIVRKYPGSGMLTIAEDLVDIVAQIKEQQGGSGR